MSILVVCPGCHKRFSVSDQFAGKTGPCPQCKTTIQVPKKGDEVVVHAPADFASGGRSVSGKLLTKPITRQDTKFRPAVAAEIAAGALGVFLLAWLGGRMALFAGNRLMPALGLLLVSPVLVVAGYQFLRDNEDLDAFHGKVLWLRSGICALAYVILWGLFSHVGSQVLTEELWSWLVVVPFFVMGSVAALASLDLDFGTGFLHYSFYVFVAVLLRAAAGLGWVWQIHSP
jgi:hypothetical protein